MSATNYPDPHKHPLYRPHHGDMTGWRYLEVGEEKKGAQWISKAKESQWQECGEYYGIPVQWNEQIIYRRRVTAESKPVECDCNHEGLGCESESNYWCCTRPKGHTGLHRACGINSEHGYAEWSDDEKALEKPVEQKRFVTVICEPQDDLSQIRIGQVYNGLMVLEIRQGNALALLDGIEERVVKAIREGGV